MDRLALWMLFGAIVVGLWCRVVPRIVARRDQRAWQTAYFLHGGAKKTFSGYDPKQQAAGLERHQARQRAADAHRRSVAAGVEPPLRMAPRSSNRESA